MFIALVTLLAIGISGLPDVKGFTPVLSKELEFKIDDYKTAFVGQVIVYQNPNDLNEFVKVYYRQVAIVSERAKEKSNMESGSASANLSNLNYHSIQEEKVLDRVQQSSDIFAYVQWRTVKDLRGQDIRDGLLNSWLLDSNGNWIFSSTQSLMDAPFSEPSKVDSKKLIRVGIQFSLRAYSHIVRVDQDDIMIPVEVANDKK